MEEVYRLLYKPRNICIQLRRAEGELEGLRFSLYPSAIRYDKDKVMSSPSDPMPVYAARVDELLTEIKELQIAYIKAQQDILEAIKPLNQLEQEILMKRYLSHKSWNEIILDLSRSKSCVFTTHKNAIKKLSKVLK